jgi:hypothetical protein
MHSRNLRRAASLAVVFSYLAFGLLGQSGYVLCVVPDGTMRIEESGPDGSCSNSGHRLHSAQPLQSAPSFTAACTGCPAVCSGCIDLGLSPDGIQDKAVSKEICHDISPLQPSLSGAQCAFQTITASSFHDRRLSSIAPSGSLFLDRISSVILLI